MSENSPIKDALYAEIDRIGQDTINELLIKKEFSMIFENIFDKAIKKINKDFSKDEKFGTMRHFSHQRWQIHTCFCCPPQIFRLSVQLNEWAYYKSNKELTIALYGAGSISTNIPEIGEVCLTQDTSYPWDGKVTITVVSSPKKEFSIGLRIPSWASGAEINLIGHKNQDISTNPGTIPAM